MVENVYTLKILNKSQNTATYKIHVEGLKDYTWQGKQQLTVGGAEISTLAISIAVDPYDIEKYMNDISFVIQQVEPMDNDVILKQSSVFFNKR